MSGIEQAAWGAGGGTAAYVTIFLLPSLVALYSGSDTKSVNLKRLVGMALLYVVFASFGGVAAALMAETDSNKRELFFYGLGWQGIFKGALDTVGSTVPGPDIDTN